jgi:dolichol-phosphate mannosyltransferase
MCTGCPLADESATADACSAAEGYDASLVTAVIAAKDEAPTIGAVITRTRRWVGRVIVVDGHSSDRTIDVAQRAGADVLVDHGRGKGDAVRVGIGAVTTPVTVLLDADGSHDPESIPCLVWPIVGGRADHVSASRLRGGSSELHGGFDEFVRLAGSAFITAWINWWFDVRLSDSQNGFRALRTDVLAALHLRANSTTIEQEMIMRSLRLGCRMLEIPSHERARVAGRSHISILRAVVPYVWSLARQTVFAGRRREPA